MPNPKHILVIRLSAMGDVAMTIPVLKALTNQYPQLKITFLTRPFFTPFFRDLDNVEVYPIDLNKKHKGAFGLYKLSKALKKLNIDAVADLHNVLRTNILKRFFFGKQFVQIDKGRAEKKALIKGEIFEPLKTTHQRYADVFETLGYKIDLNNPSFTERKPLPKSITDIIETQDKKQWIGIAPFAQYQSKMYPLDLLKQVVDQLKDDYTIFLFGGGAKEKTQLDTIASTSNNIINCVERFSLKEELDLISNLDLMLSMDSGNAHIGAMLGVKVITIWGVTHPYAGFGAFNQPETHHLLPNKKQYPKIPTSIYGNKYPEDYKNCAGNIQPEEVVKQLKNQLIK